jgi:dihydroorotate dehydrogenase/Pyruvate/2-oxoacid:ferredoxin oxidoreductase delta subunit
MRKDVEQFKDLGINLAGVRVPTPIGVGPVGLLSSNPKSVTPDMRAEVLLKDAEAGAGYICLPTTRHITDALLSDLEKKAKVLQYRKASHRPPIIYLRANEERTTMYNIGPPAINPVSQVGAFQRNTLELIHILRRKKPKDVPLIGSISGLGQFPESYVAGAQAVEQAGVDLIELNLSSPSSLARWENVEGYFDGHFPLSPLGFLLGDRPEDVENITREVVQAVSIPVGVKLSPETGFPRIIDIARRIKAAGAAYINCSNMGITIIGPDIYNRGKSKWPFVYDNPFVCVSGDWLRTIVYKQVAAISKFVPGIDIMACGGLSNPEHIVEVMMLGAKAIQIVTPVLYHGRREIKRDIRFLRKYMNEQGYHNLNEIVGLSLEYIKPADELNSAYDDNKRLFAHVDTKTCTGCGICTDSICLALYIEDGKAKLDSNNCIGCGMCAAVCPRNAITLINTVESKG